MWRGGAVQMHLSTLEAAHIDMVTWNLPEAAEESDAMSMSSTSSHIGWGRSMRRAATAAGASRHVTANHFVTSGKLLNVWV